MFPVSRKINDRIRTSSQICLILLQQGISPHPALAPKHTCTYTLTKAIINKNLFWLLVAIFSMPREEKNQLMTQNLFSKYLGHGPENCKRLLFQVMTLLNNMENKCSLYSGPLENLKNKCMPSICDICKVILPECLCSTDFVGFNK